MKPYTFEDGLMLGFAVDKHGHCNHPQLVTYVKDDQDYEPPDIRQGETFDTYTEEWIKENIVTRTHVWGVGVIHRGDDNETVTRLVYPDGTYVELEGF